MFDFPAPPKVHVLHVPGVDPHRDSIVARLADECDLCEHADHDRRGVMVNWLSALSCATDNDVLHTWSVIVQDDADPLSGWQQHLERACKNSPTPILGLTHFGGYGKGVADQGFPYALGRGLVWGGAVAYSRSEIEGLNEWANRVHSATGYRHDDRLIGAYAIRRGFLISLAARAVFDQPVERSTLGHNTPARRPVLTIADSGPTWETKPSGKRVSVALDERAKELAREFR